MQYYVVDAFADRVFEGNPAGVCVLEDWPADALMQNIATENNLSETAFAVGGGGRYRLRWFTPGGEIDLCGHATLATAFVIDRFVEPGRESLSFETAGGELTVARKGDLYELDFPSLVPEPHAPTEAMAEALGVVPAETYLRRDLMFLLRDEAQVRDLKPDFSRLTRLADGLGVIVTARGSEFDFVSRAFFPKLGVDEDPVCGSAHCNLIPFWSARLGKETMVARQLSRRGGTLYCRLDGERVKMAGRAALYSRAELFVEPLPAGPRS